MSSDELLLNLELRSDPQMLCVVRGALAQLTELLGFTETESRAIVLAVDEALTNIIRHAYKGRAKQPIMASFRRVQAGQPGTPREAFEIILEDHGEPVDSTKLRGRALEDVRPGGLGLHFIRQSVDEVEFRREGGRNQLRLLKFLRTSEPGKGS